MLNKHNVLHKTLYTLHKNDERPQNRLTGPGSQTPRPRRRGRSRPWSQGPQGP